jgi:hypothetical protein
MQTGVHKNMCLGSAPASVSLLGILENLVTLAGLTHPCDKRTGA